MQIAAAGTPGTAPLPPEVAPATKLAQELQWLTEEGLTGHYVRSVEPVAADAVRIVVQDPNAFDYPDDQPHMNQWVADNAASILEPVIDGVRLLVETPEGTAGEPGYFSRDEQYFATNIPGVTYQAGETWRDITGNDEMDPGEESWEFPVASEADAARIDRVVLDEIQDLPVRFEIMPRG